MGQIDSNSLSEDEVSYQIQRDSEKVRKLCEVIEGFMSGKISAITTELAVKAAIKVKLAIQWPKFVLLVDNASLSQLVQCNVFL